MTTFTKIEIDAQIATIPNYYDCAICTCEHDNDPDLCNCSQNLNYDFDNCENNDDEFDANCQCNYCKNFKYLYANEIQIIPEIYLTNEYLYALKMSRQ